MLNRKLKLAHCHNRGRNLYSLQNTAHQAAVKIVSFSGEQPPNKARVGLSANNFMAIVFKDARGIIHILRPPVAIFFFQTCSNGLAERDFYRLMK